MCPKSVFVFHSLRETQMIAMIGLQMDQKQDRDSHFPCHLSFLMDQGWWRPLQLCSRERAFILLSSSYHVEPQRANGQMKNWTQDLLFSSTHNSWKEELSTTTNKPLYLLLQKVSGGHKYASCLLSTPYGQLALFDTLGWPEAGSSRNCWDPGGATEMITGVSKQLEQIQLA